MIRSLVAVRVDTLDVFREGFNMSVTKYNFIFTSDQVPTILCDNKMRDGCYENQAVYHERNTACPDLLRAKVY